MLSVSLLNSKQAKRESRSVTGVDFCHSPVDNHGDSSVLQLFPHFCGRELAIAGGRKLAIAGERKRGKSGSMLESA